MKNPKEKKEKYWVWIILTLSLVGSAFLYREVFFAYFFQDDWFSLRISNAGSIGDVIGFFVPRTDVIYYRPLGMQVPYFLLQRFFGLTSFPYHALTFTFHAANIVLVYRLLQRFHISPLFASIGSFLYGVSTVHYMPLYWTATFAFAAGPTFLFSSFLVFISFLSNGIYQRYFLSLALFLLGLLTNEMVAVLPFLFGIYMWYERKQWRGAIWLLPYIVCIGVLFLLRFFVFSPPLSGSYEQAVGVAIVHNIKGYVLWSLQFPEEIAYQFISFFRLNGQFVSDFARFLTIQTWATSVFILSVGAVWVMEIRLGRIKKLAGIFLFSLGWFLIGLLPVLFFTGHSFSYYLPVSLVGMIYFIVYGIQSASKKNVRFSAGCAVVMMTAWFFAGMNTVGFNAAVHFAPRRARLSGILSKKAKIYYPESVLKNKPVIYVDPSSENILSLNNQDGLIVIYDMPMLVTKYEHVDDAEVL